MFVFKKYEMLHSNFNHRIFAFKNYIMSQFHSLSIHNIIRETAKAVTLSFVIPSEIKDTFRFTAGQYITLKAMINGKEVRRAYSLCATPTSGKLSVTIKEVEGGIFSAHANRNLKEGDILEVAPPEGRFEIDNAFAKAQHTYAAFAAGSGITPIMSMIKTVLEESSESKFVLVYGNKKLEDTIFREELLALRNKYQDRFSIEFIYSQNREDGAHYGRIMKSTVDFVVKNKYAAANFDHYYLCGPETMIKEVTQALKKNDVGEEQIHFELFTASKDTAIIEESLDGTSQIKIVCDDEEFSFTMPQDELILDAALDQDIDAPHSCQGGVCSSCIARVTEGTAVMEKNQILTDSEVAEGLILTCQAHPTSATLIVDFDDV